MDLLQTPTPDFSERRDVYRVHVKSVDSTNSLAVRIADAHLSQASQASRISRAWVDSAREVVERENLTLVSCCSLHIHSAQNVESYVQAVISADTQSQGRGRLGRVWIDADQRSLCASYVVRVPRHTYQRCGQWISTIAGLSTVKAVGEAVKSVCDVDVDDAVALKWPNDLYCGDAKFGGILVEAHSQTVSGGSDDEILVIGVGLNGDISPDVNSTYKTTSLHRVIQSAQVTQSDQTIQSAHGSVHNADEADGIREYSQYHTRLMDAIIADTVRELNSFLSGLIYDAEHAIPSVREQAIVHSAILGREVTASLPDGSTVHGTALDIDAEAGLVVALDDGQEKHITVGDVSVRLT